jgi:hypothetical protein
LRRRHAPLFEPARQRKQIRMSASRCPCGVIAYRGDIVCYELAPRQPAEADAAVEDGVLRARRLGHESLLEITPELRAAIEADLRKHPGAKR